MRDAIAGDAPGRPRHGVLPQVSALIRLRWPVLSRRLLITAGGFFPGYIAGCLVVDLRALGPIKPRLTPPLPGRGGTRPGIGRWGFFFLGRIWGPALIP